MTPIHTCSCGSQYELSDSELKELQLESAYQKALSDIINIYKIEI